MPTLKVRSTEASDVAGLKTIIEATGLFPPDMLADMLAAFLAGNDTEIWLSCLQSDDIVGVCYARAEELTDGTWNMLALGVPPSHQNEGVGKHIVAALEERLASQGARLLIVDTSGTNDFAGARAFYAKVGYVEEARIRDYWADGDDKITFAKSLGGLAKK